MKTLIFAVCLSLPVCAVADTIYPKTGEPIRGIIQKIEAGRVTIESGGSARVLELANVEQIDFDTPHLTEGTGRLPLEHFQGDMDAQEMARLGQELKQVRQELRTMLDRIQREWRGRPSVERDQTQPSGQASAVARGQREWEAEKERFQAPLARYREILDDLYFHVLAQVDDYNGLVGEAHDVYVGVRGVFRVGSPLVPSDATELPAKEFVPQGWFDKIYYEAYRDGFKDAKEFEALSPR